MISVHHTRFLLDAKQPVRLRETDYAFLFEHVDGELETTASIIVSGPSRRHDYGRQLCREGCHPCQGCRWHVTQAKPETGGNHEGARRPC